MVPHNPTPRTPQRRRSRRRHSTGRACANLALAITLGITSLTAASCGDPSGRGQRNANPEFGYQLPQPLVTTNAASITGSATDATKLAARIYPGAYHIGTQGQLLPNRDLVTATPDPRDPHIIHYRINHSATYSDGAPVICDDFLLTKIAADRSDIFQADLPIFTQVKALNCAPGAREFTVEFHPQYGKRYRELFAPGTVLPSHTIAAKAGVEKLIDALNDADEATTERIARAWRDTFRLDITDPATVPSFGPYRITRRTEHGDVILDTNPKWQGNPPRTTPIHVWGPGANLKELAANHQITVLDAPTTAKLADFGITDADFAIKRGSGNRVDTLTLDSEAEMFHSAEQRRAFNACISREGISRRIRAATGIPVTPAGLRLISPAHPLAGRLLDLSRAQTRRDTDTAQAALAGRTIRIGFPEETPRFRIILESLSRACGDAGITLTAVPIPATKLGTPGNRLGDGIDALLDTRSFFARNSTANAGNYFPLEDIRSAEEKLAAQSLTIPLVTEPRSIAYDRRIKNVIDNSTGVGLSWNMDRWRQTDSPQQDD